MSGLVLQDIVKKFNDQVFAVAGVSVTFEEGKLTALVGPSGCGKTTLLRMIAGLETPTSGNLLLNNSDISSIPAHERRFGMVFQSFALFPHLNVQDNIGYSLSISGVAVKQRRKRAAELLELVKLDGFGPRRINDLSGGQRQRVAIARALAQEPRIFLLDEPMSALDAQLREEMQIELRLLQQELGITTIVVTHDQREAMTMADKIVVMNVGKVEQEGKPQQVYNQPVSKFVASFIGKINIINGIVDQGRLRVGSNWLETASELSYRNGATVHVTCRPESTLLVEDGVARNNRIPAVVTFIRDIGSIREVFLKAADTTIICEISSNSAPALVNGSQVVIEFPSDALQVFPLDAVA